MTAVRADLNGRVGTVIRRYRKTNNLTQREVARRCELTQASISQLESGKRINNLSSLERLSHALGLTMGELFDLAAAIDSKTLKDALNRRADDAIRDADERGWLSLEELEQGLHGNNKR